MNTPVSLLRPFSAPRREALAGNACCDLWGTSMFSSLRFLRPRENGGMSVLREPRVRYLPNPFNLKEMRQRRTRALPFNLDERESKGPLPWHTLGQDRSVMLPHLAILSSADTRIVTALHVTTRYTTGECKHAEAAGGIPLVYAGQRQGSSVQ